MLALEVQCLCMFLFELVSVFAAKEYCLSCTNLLLYIVFIGTNSFLRWISNNVGTRPVCNRAFFEKETQWFSPIYCLSGLNTSSLFMKRLGQYTIKAFTRQQRRSMLRRNNSGICELTSSILFLLWLSVSGRQWHTHFRSGLLLRSRKPHWSFGRSKSVILQLHDKSLRRENDSVIVRTIWWPDRPQLLNLEKYRGFSKISSVPDLK